MFFENTFFNHEDYTLTDKVLGEGSFGTVFVVIKKSDKTKYAAKVLKYPDGMKSSDQKQFMRETMLMKTLKHPSIILFEGMSFNSFKDNKQLQPTILMEYLPNGSLENILNDEKKSIVNHEWTTAKKYICLLGISHAMNYIHKNRVEHRDLKPGNILMDDKFYPHISDFGLSRCFRNYLEDSKNLEKTIGIGTPKYMAPELLTSQINYTSKVDVYAFGIIAFEIVTGMDPFISEDEGLSLFLLQKKVLAGQLKKFTPDTKEPMKYLIQSCLSVDPDERPTFEKIYEILSKNLGQFFDLQDEEIYEIEDYIELLNNFDEKNEIKKSLGIDNKLQQELINKNDTKKIEKERSRYSKIIEEFIENTKDVNQKDQFGNTLLHKICTIGNISLVKKIISSMNIDIKILNSEHQSILYSIIESENLELFEYILSLNKLDVTIIDKQKRNLLHYSCKLGNIEFTQYLISLSKIDLNSKDCDEKTVLHYCCESGNLKLFKYLLSLDKLNILAKDKRKTTVLHYACKSGNINLVKYIISMNIFDLTHRNNERKTCLFFACESYSLSLIKYLVSLNKFRLFLRDKYGNTLLHYSSRKGNLNIFKFNFLTSSN